VQQFRKSAGGATLNRKLILLVDDEPDICAEMSIFLSKKGYDVIVANNGKDAIDLFKLRNPILVITDFKMPGMDGIELLKKIKLINRDIHVILMSGVADIKTTVTAMKADAFDFVAKPVDLKKLEQAIKVAIQRAVDSLSRKGKKLVSLFLTHEGLEGEQPVSVLYFNINIDEYSQERYRAEFHDLMVDGHLREHIIFNMQSVMYINNIGLNFLIYIKESLNERNHKIYMCNVQNPVQNYLSTLGYSSFFNVETSLETIIEKIRY